MANYVYTTEEIRLLDDTEITVRPLSIKYLKQFTAQLKKMQEKDEEGNDKVKTEEDALEVFIGAGMICMKQFCPDLSNNKTKFEEVIEVPTLMRILEVGGGFKLNDPNLLEATADLIGTI